jgi:hypothetical protein
VSQRLLLTVEGTRAPAVEVMLSTKLIADLIEKGDFSGLKEAIEKSIADGSQTFELDIAKMISAGVVTRKEGLVHADSPTNLMWRLDNDFHVAAKAAAEPQEDPDDEPSFTEMTRDVTPGLLLNWSERPPRSLKLRASVWPTVLAKERSMPLTRPPGWCCGSSSCRWMTSMVWQISLYPNKIKVW